MSKQIKLGLERTPAPTTPKYVPLRDFNTLEILRDDAGNPIVTEELVTDPSFVNSGNSISSHVNNGVFTTEIQHVKIVEQFAEVSQVSSSLLGVPRAEVQLGLFSDVSVYGYDSNTWDFYNFTSYINDPPEWYSRSSKLYGARKNIDLIEKVDEQALVITGFPVQYAFPYGPKFESQSRYNQVLFRQYMNFIAIGRMLYEYFASEGFELFARNNFLSNNIKIITSSDSELEPGIDYRFEFVDPEYVIVGSDQFYDISYGSNIRNSFDEIERYTAAYKSIIGGSFRSPVANFKPALNEIYAGLLSISQSTRPGYADSPVIVGSLESRQSYRYQPGRISGFTFGVRAKTEENRLSNIIEWGCANSTDQYMFQIRGPEFNIVRRSTVPLPEDIVVNRLRMPADSQKQSYPNDIENPNQLYELVIGSDFFNGDKLDGTGPSGYNINIKNVTMFKIEFGWYGAIGAKFYAYIPSENDQARWVLMHTLVIENGLGKPCLENPEFKFKYFMNIRDTSELYEPVYIYKYGASYYIDGGDQGNLKIASENTERTSFDSNTSVLGIMPKPVIFNGDGVFRKNQITAYPSEISVRTTQPARMEIKEIVGSPDGFHFSYAPSLRNRRSDLTKSVTLLLNVGKSSVTLETGEFESSDDNKKIIADGIYNAYLKLDTQTTNSADILRSTRINDIQRYTLVNRPLLDEVVFKNGTSLELPDDGSYQITADLTGLNDTIVASTIPISTSDFRIHWLNPTPKDITHSGRHFADFAISFTDKLPKIVEIVGEETVEELRFGDLDEEYDFYSDASAMIWRHDTERIDIEGREVSEWDPTWGIRYDIDPRLPIPSGSDSGIISAIQGSITVINHELVGITTIDPVEQIYEVEFKDQANVPVISNSDIGYSTVGVDGIEQNAVFNSSIIERIETDPETGISTTRYFVELKGDVSGITANTSIQTKRMTLSSDFRVQSYDSSGTRRFGYKTHIRSKNIKFSARNVYPVIGMNNYARLNSIVIEEISKVSSSSHTPNWITRSVSRDGETVVDIVVNSGGSSSLLSPTNFVEKERLVSSRFDGQNQQPLRPGRTVGVFYATPADTSSIDLTNIFGTDRNSIKPGLRNNLAYYITASRIGSNPGGDIDIGIIVKEQ